MRVFLQGSLLIFSFCSSLEEESFSVSFFFAFAFAQSFANRLLQLCLLLLHMWVVLVVYCRFLNEISQPIAILTNQSQPQWHCGHSKSNSSSKSSSIVLLSFLPTMKEHFTWNGESPHWSPPSTSQYTASGSRLVCRYRTGKDSFETHNSVEFFGRLIGD